MLLALLSLGCIAFVGSLVVGEDSNDEDTSDDEVIRTNSESPDEIDVFLPENTGGSSDEIIKEWDLVSDVRSSSEKVLSEDLQVPGAAIIEEVAGSVKSDDNTTSLIYTRAADGGIPPLSDLFLESGIEIANLADVDEIIIEKSSQPGSLKIIQADYYERLGSTGEEIVHNIHSGANVYFIPDGEQFPEQYRWSESGASLYNTDKSSNEADDFGGIELILRIDTGSLYADNESGQADEFKARAYLELQEQFSSDEKIIF